MTRCDGCRRDIEALQRQVAELLARSGMSSEELDAFRRRDAVQLMVKHLDPSGIKEYLRTKNSPRPMAGIEVSGE
jgi:hypothetical protein